MPEPIHIATLCFDRAKLFYISTISQECGLGSEEKMRRAFIRHVGVTVKEYRQGFKNI